MPCRVSTRAHFGACCFLPYTADGRTTGVRSFLTCLGHTYRRRIFTQNSLYAFILQNTRAHLRYWWLLCRSCCAGSPLTFRGPGTTSDTFIESVRPPSYASCDWNRKIHCISLVWNACSFIIRAFVSIRDCFLRVSHRHTAFSNCTCVRSFHGNLLTTLATKY